MPESATYIYCLVERARRPVLRHLPRGLPFATTPELIDLGKRLWAVAATVPLDEYGSEPLERRLTDINWVADIALAHEGVVEYFASRTGATVVPMKLFTMFSSRERAATELAKRRRQIAPVLARIRGCREWGVRVTRRPLAATAAAAPAARSSGTAFLAAKKQARDEVRERALRSAAAAEAVVATLSRLARASVRREPPENAAAPPLVDAAFLVAAANNARFRAAAEKSAKACRAAGADLVLTGPWPAYNFVQQMPEPA
ncbi:MAG TPA: GvpL/GvpF family gas vesicle protein [Vicinamibacterales bacterium]|nr:GvpL/GvpF family gas vesicle protein [Vicinamibacterales bacterium]